MPSSLMIDRLRCEYLENPLGLGERRPRLSWRLASQRRGAAQSAYQIQVASNPERLAAGEGDLWDSGRIDSDETIHIGYDGEALASRRRCYWRVRVWDEAGQVSDWSDVSFWEMGLMAAEDWRAQWISPDIPEDKSEMQPSPMLRTSFGVNGVVKKARIYVTSRGAYELRLNGKRVGDVYFTPGWTSYHKRLQYQVYDVTQQLQNGENGLGAMLGDGWYRGYYFVHHDRNFYGDTLAVLAQLEIEYEDGRVQVVCSDKTWRSCVGPIRYADHYMGEYYDAREEKSGWASAGFDDSGWASVRVCDYPFDTLTATVGPPVRKIEERAAVEILTTPAGETVVDFGQNMVGWVRLRVSGPRGTKIILRHTEVLDQEGNFYVEHLRSAEQKVTYVLKGEGIEVFEPHFTFQGFRYVAVDGYPGDLGLDALTGVVLHSDIAPSGEFECSNPLVNQLQHNITWGQKGNFLDVPTDCPQRDERYGWTGDAQVFMPTACFNFDVAAFFSKWLKDVVADQHPTGAFPNYVPNISHDPPEGCAAWGDAGVICPWIMYQVYGDKRILEEHYDSMTAWIAYIHERAGESLIWRNSFQFGDWLATDRPDLGTPFGLTDTDLIATAYFAYSAGLLAKIADTLGKDDDAAAFSLLFERVRQAFCDEFVTPNGRVGANTQTAYVLALAFDLLPEQLREAAVARLVQDIRNRDNHLATGFVGTAQVNHVLSRFDYLDVAYDLLLQDTCPSWLYAVTQGATTIWERWDGIRPDGSFQTPEMNSFNHYAYGAIGAWLYKVVSGIRIDPEQPSYKHIIIHPQPGGGLSYARASYDSIRGRIVSAWRKHAHGFRLDVVIPANTTAAVTLPANSAQDVMESGQPLGDVAGVLGWEDAPHGLVVTVASGSYHFEVASPQT